MYKSILLAAFISLTSFGFSQDYSYSFSGDFSSEQIELLESKVSKVNHVTAAKVKYKSDRNAGEILITVEPVTKESQERDDVFSPADVKSILLDLGLNPISFRSL